MTWSNGGKTRTGSGPWPKVRRQALERDGWRCTVVEHGQRCMVPAREVDHIVNHANGGTDTLDNAASICPAHHLAKTLKEAAEGRRRQAARAKAPREPHPGITR